MKFGVIRFPGSCDETDAVLACERVPGASATLLWHGDRDLQGVEAVIVPGGFSYGDYLRVGAIARFSPVMESVIAFSRQGGLVLGICNGFQVLCEAGLLPGALLPNVGLRFLCRQVDLEVERAGMPFMADCAPGERLSIPVKHTTGRYYAPPQDLAAPRGTWPDPPAVCIRREPQRVVERHRGRVQRGGQRLRAHAAPRARRRSAHRLERRAEDLPVDGPCARLIARSRSA